MSNSRDVKHLIHPHYLIVDKITGLPFAGVQLGRDLSKMKTKISRSYSQEIQSNEDLWKSLQILPRNESEFFSRLKMASDIYDLACDEFKLLPNAMGSIEGGLNTRLCCGVQYGLYQVIQHMLRLEQWNHLKADSTFVKVRKDLEEFREFCHRLIKLQPMASTRYKWEKLQSIEILEITTIKGTPL